MNKEESPSECEACGTVTSSASHDDNCLAPYTPDGSCNCKVISKSLNYLNYHGRKMWLCDDCFAKENALKDNGEMNLHEYQKNIPDRIEHRVTAEMKSVDTVANWQSLYTTERAQWVLSNFESIEDMRTRLFEFILSLEKLTWEHKTKKRAAYDAAAELDTRLSKEQREALINDPNFKVPTNSEFKKIAAEREADELMKTLGVRLTAQQLKSFAALRKMGFSVEAIKEQMKIE